MGTVVQLNDPGIRLIAAKRAADAAHLAAIDTDDEEEACYAAYDIAWKLANTPPTTLEGVAAVLRFANQVEDEGCEWPDTDTIGREGWHYQLRATMAAAIETILRGRQ